MVLPERRLWLGSRERCHQPYEMPGVSFKNPLCKRKIKGLQGAGLNIKSGFKDERTALCWVILSVKLG